MLTAPQKQKQTRNSCHYYKCHFLLPQSCQWHEWDHTLATINTAACTVMCACKLSPSRPFSNEVIFNMHNYFNQEQIPNDHAYLHYASLRNWHSGRRHLETTAQFSQSALLFRRLTGYYPKLNSSEFLWKNTDI